MAKKPQFLTVPDALRGVLLHDFLQRAFPRAALVALRQAVGAGLVRRNGMVELRNVKLRGGDVVELRADPAGLRQRPRPGRGAHGTRAGAGPGAGAADGAGATELAVLAETAHALVVAKPAGLPTVPDRSGEDQGLWGLLDALRPGADLRIVHRLDRDTSGCLLLAKGVEAARHFDRAFQERAVTKEYLALVHGELFANERQIDLPLGPDRRRPGKVVAARSASAVGQRGFREARTTVRVAERFAGYTLLRLAPATGRGHQLRVHCNAIGHPIVGDADYGGEPLLLSHLKPDFKLRPGQTETPLLARMFLHAASLSCQDVDGADLAAAAPLPDDLARALDKVRRHRAARRSGPRRQPEDQPCD